MAEGDRSVKNLSDFTDLPTSRNLFPPSTCSLVGLPSDIPDHLVGRSVSSLLIQVGSRNTRQPPYFPTHTHRIVRSSNQNNFAVVHTPLPHRALPAALLASISLREQFLAPQFAQPHGYRLERRRHRLEFMANEPDAELAGGGGAFAQFQRNPKLLERPSERSLR